MSTNRHLITDLDIIRPTQLLDKGLPLPFLSNKYVVEEGWCAVITEGGTYKEILEPGTHFLGKYHMFRDVMATKINMRVNTLNLSTIREFTISKPIPVEINLDLAVEYKVTDPRRVAIEITTPLTSLFDRVIQAVRGCVVYTTVDEIRTQGENIARGSLQRLQGMQLPKVIGIEVNNVLVTSIKATDAGNDALAAQQMKEYTTYRDWQLDNAILQGSKITPEWMIVNRPDLYKELMAGHFEVVKELIDMRLLDPAAFLNQPNNTATIDPSRLLDGLGFPGLGPSSQTSSTSESGQPQLPTNTMANQPTNIHSRMQEEVAYLNKLAGAKVHPEPNSDATGIPDGSYKVKVEIPRNSGGTIMLYILCPTGYPSNPPVIEVEVDNQPTPFQSIILRRWMGQYLVEIAREVKQYFG